MFLLEILVKITALRSVHAYVKDPLNVFDALVVVLSMLGMALEVSGATDDFSFNFSVFRTFRIVRLLVSRGECGGVGSRMLTRTCDWTRSSASSTRGPCSAS